MRTIGTPERPGKTRRRFYAVLKEGEMNRPNYLPVAFLLVVSCGVVVPRTALGASWAATCTNVLASDRGLWFDSPGPSVPGENTEGGFFWFVNNGSNDEKCTYQTTAGGPDYISTTDFPTLRVRVAVNDGARFKVEVFSIGFEFCDELVGSITTTRTEDDSAFRTKEVTLPAGHSICAVAITLDDDPNDSPGEDSGRVKARVKALIDYIHIRNATTYGWTESFSGGNP
jgi:hypothetical protein